MIVVELLGGLGNQMFQYAIGFSLAKKNNTDLFFDTYFLLDRSPKHEHFVYRDYDLDIFNIQNKTVDENISLRYGHCSSYFNKIKNKLWSPKPLQLVQEKHYHYDKEVLALTGDLYISGFWQSYKYFSHNKDEISNKFSFNTEVLPVSKSLFKEIVSSESVCLNVRRTDFVNVKFHGTMDAAYYVEAEKILLSKSDRPLNIFVFSDDIKWCRDNIRLTSKTCFVEHIHAGHKFSNYFHLMCLCKNFIIPNSSFAWWAAWLGKNAEKQVIAPKVWFGGANRNTSDLIPNNWVRI